MITTALVSPNLWGTGYDIYGIVKEHYINWAINPIENQRKFSICEVSVNGTNDSITRSVQVTKELVRLDKPSPELLGKLHAQSKKNIAGIENVDLRTMI